MSPSLFSPGSPAKLAAVAGVLERDFERLERQDRFARHLDVRVDECLDLVLVEFLIILLVPGEAEDLLLKPLLAVVHLVVEPLGDRFEHQVDAVLLLEEEHDDDDHRDGAGSVGE